MRTLVKNKQKMYYALQIGKVPIYTEYVDEEGNRYRIETGEYKVGYGNPVEFYGNISMSGGDLESVEYGLNLGDYEAILVVGKNTLPIDETSLIWLNTEPEYDSDGIADEKTADYKVIKISHSLNVDKYVLKKLVK